MRLFKLISLLKNSIYLIYLFVVVIIYLAACARKDREKAVLLHKKKESKIPT